LLSRLQKNPGIGRFVSAVIRFAAVNGSETPFTQRFIVPFHGLRNAMWRPSGEIVPVAISGLPKNSSRSMSGGSPASMADVRAGAGACRCGAAWPACAAAAAATALKTMSVATSWDFMGASLQC
jgi:hypothetical protein